MRSLGAALVLALSCGAARAEVKAAAHFDQPAPANADLGDWPIWDRLIIRRQATAGDADGLAYGRLDLTWVLTADPGVVYAGPMPLIGDFNGDGRPDVAAVQYETDTGWRAVLIDLPPSGPAFLGETSFTRYGTHAGRLLALAVADIEGAAADQLVLIMDTGATQIMVSNSLRDGVLVARDVIEPSVVLTKQVIDADGDCNAGVGTFLAGYNDAGLPDGFLLPSDILGFLDDHFSWPSRVLPAENLKPCQTAP